ncbi:MAG: hypothetical protein R3228_14745 [Halioglobus sp.]|nr:hypothetical protein [Halioglobus sp.]
MTDTAVSDRTGLVQLLWLPLVVYYLVVFAGQLLPGFHAQSLVLTNTGEATSISETALIEHLEALFWACGMAGYAASAWRRRALRLHWGWPLVFSALCFFALGEETSWGQHLLDFRPPDVVIEANTQDELNLHNLHLAKVLGVSAQSPLYPYLGSVTAILNPLFYLLCVTAWLILPVWLRRRPPALRPAALRHYPRHQDAFYAAFSVAVVLYLVIDRGFFDVGELFELTLATAGAITGLVHRIDPG